MKKFDAVIIKDGKQQKWWFEGNDEQEVRTYVEQKNWKLLSLNERKPLTEAKGVNGQLELLDNKIRIKRKGVLALFTQGLKGEKDILIKQISSIQLKKAGLTNGYIQFAFLGGQETKGGLFDAVDDENTIMFTSWQQVAFEEMKTQIESKMAEGETKKTESHGLNDLEKLADLRSKGVITEEEFNLKKKQILGL